MAPTLPMAARSLSLRGEWRAGLAGGCPKYETYGNNPQFLLNPSVPASFVLELAQQESGARLLPLGLVVLNRDPSQPFKAKLSSKRLVAKTNFKATPTRELTVQLEPLPADKAYCILCSTFEPDQVRRAITPLSSLL